MHEPSNSKRRLELMPEVLPAPTQQVGNASVRARTMGHMHKMMAAAGALAGCSRAFTQGDNTITISPTTSASTSPTTATIPSAPSTIGTPPTTPIPTVPSGPATGYMVVDMLPSPARCYGVGASVNSSAVWRQDTTGLYAELTLTATVPANAFQPKSASVWGGALMAAGGTATTMLIKVRPSPGNTSFGASVDVFCGPSTGAVVATVQLSGPKKVGGKLPVTVIDR